MHRRRPPITSRLRRTELYTVPNPELVAGSDDRARQEYASRRWLERIQLRLFAFFTGRSVTELVYDARLAELKTAIEMEQPGMVSGDPAMVGERFLSTVRRLASLSARIRPVINTLLSPHPDRFLIYLTQRHVPDLDAAVAADLVRMADEFISSQSEGPLDHSQFGPFFTARLRDRLNSYGGQIQTNVRPLWLAVAVLHAAVTFDFNKFLPRAENADRTTVVPLRAIVSPLARLMQLTAQFSTHWKDVILEDIHTFVGDLPGSGLTDIAAFAEQLKQLGNANRLRTLIAIGGRDPFVEVRIPPPEIDWYEDTIEAWLESLLPRAVQSVLARHQRVVTAALSAHGVSTAESPSILISDLPSRTLSVCATICGSERIAATVRAGLQLIIDARFSISAERDQLHQALVGMENAVRILRELFLGDEDRPPVVQQHLERLGQNENSSQRRTQAGVYLDGIKAKVFPEIDALTNGFAIAARIIARRKEPAEQGTRITYRNSAVLGVAKSEPIEFYLDLIAKHWAPLGTGLTQLFAAERSLRGNTFVAAS